MGIIEEICGMRYDEGMGLYEVCEDDVKVGRVMGMCGICKEEGRRGLLKNGEIVKGGMRDRER